MKRSILSRFTAVLAINLMMCLNALAQPSCPTDEHVEIRPENPSTNDTIILRLRALMPPPARPVFWVFTGQSGNELTFDVSIAWQGGPGAPPNEIGLDPLPPGEYALLISPFIVTDGVPAACPPFTLPLSVSGTPTAAVPAPLFSPPMLLLLIATMGAVGWVVMRRH